MAYLVTALPGPVSGATSGSVEFGVAGPSPDAARAMRVIWEGCGLRGRGRSTSLRANGGTAPLAATRSGPELMAAPSLRERESADGGDLDDSVCRAERGGKRNRDRERRR